MQVQDEKSFIKLFIQPNEYAKHIERLYLGYLNVGIPSDFEEKYGKIVADRTSIVWNIGKIFCDDIMPFMKERAYNSLKKNNIVKKVTSNLRSFRKPHYIDIELKNGLKFSAQEFSSMCPSYAEYDPEIYSERRFTKCHQKAIELALGLSESDVRAVTGYVCGATTKAKYSHSWIETVLKGQPVVIDAVNNVVMDKDAYYYLNLCEVVSRVKGSDVFKDSKILRQLPEGLVVDGFYLMFRDEIMKDLEKNEQLYQQE